MKKPLKIALYVLLALVLIVLAYVIYVFAAYYRVEDWQTLDVVQFSVQDHTTGGESALPMEGAPQAGVTYRVSSANIGFGAYSDDYSFFMDGGKESRARSADAVRENVCGEAALVNDLTPDFALFQEVDIDGTRSWHIAEDAYLSDVMENSEFNEVFAQNYDSPYLFYPLINPHGANQSGIVTLSRHPISSAVRRSLPIETGVMKLVDLDRCYSVSRIPMENGKELVLYNLHLSAYTSDGTIATEQLEMLCADMLAEYENGNYCVAGGDFNKDLLGNSAEIFGVAGGENDTWAQPIPEGTIPDGLSLVVPFDADHPVATCRTANEPYNEETTFRVTVDGFLVSDNVEAVSADVVDAGYRYSDHNPIYMDFILKAE